MVHNHTCHRSVVLSLVSEPFLSSLALLDAFLFMVYKIPPSHKNCIVAFLTGNVFHTVVFCDVHCEVALGCTLGLTVNTNVLDFHEDVFLVYLQRVGIPSFIIRFVIAFIALGWLLGVSLFDVGHQLGLA